MSAPLLEVRDLRTVFHTPAGAFAAVDGASFSVARGEVLGLVGESGSGKSVTGFSIMGLIDPPGEIAGGEILFKGEDLLRKPESELRQLRGDRIATIFQDPLMTLNPVLRIGVQMAEAIEEHAPVSREEALARARALGHAAVLLVGDAPYYARFGFSAEAAAALMLPGPYERERFLAFELVPGALDGARGLVAATGAFGEKPDLAAQIARAPLRQAA